MRYILNGTEIPRPSEMARDFIFVKSDLISLNGRTTLDYSAVKERFLLRWDFLSQAEITTLNSIIDLNTSVSFQIDENNLTVASTSVFPFISKREYATPSGSYFELIE